MLLFSTILSINDSMTKDAFIELVINWNQSSRYQSNIIENLVWNGERNIRYETDLLSLTIEEYRNKNIIAVRYEKIDENGVIWDTDYIMNFDEMRMAIQLDRSYTEDALAQNANFSTPFFITMLIENGYLKDDSGLPVSNKPIVIDDNNSDVLAGILNGEQKYKLPVVYVSKTVYNEDPVDAELLANKLKGCAHVLLQENVSTGKELKELCSGNNEYHGAIGIYYPNSSVGHMRYLYRRDTGYDNLLLDKVVRSVLHYSNIQNITNLYTWQGVRSALLNDRLLSQREERLAAQKAQQEAENEVDSIYAEFDEDIKELQRQVDELSKANEALRCENLGLRSKMESVESVPILYLGAEDEFYPGEIKDMVLAALEDALRNTKGTSRRADVIRDVFDSNGYKNICGERQQEIKNLLKGYDGMSRALRQDLMDMGFEITEEGKHYKLTYYGDRRYWTTLAKTPSDHREGKNSALTICREML